MNTPICDFVEAYINNDPIRMHMPGHKGKPLLGFEPRDITEINGADSLFEATGIIAESEMNASSLFGCNSFYSTEGSSLSIRAMVYLLRLWGGDNTKIIAFRNAHKAFVSAIALLDIDVEWLSPSGNYLSTEIDLTQLEASLSRNSGKALGVYITSPDYLGGMADVRAVSRLCKQYGARLLVDNAHGAYLKFLNDSLHPIDLGADMCCDSAHKTLPALTGGAYLHIAKGEEFFASKAKDAMALFASTSPSYLILQSLDKVNLYLSHGYKEMLNHYTDALSALKQKISGIGYSVISKEPLKLTIETKKYGYYGTQLAEILYEKGIVCEFADKDYLVMMFTPENGDNAFGRVLSVLECIPKRAEITELPPAISDRTTAITPREALFAKSEVIPIGDECLGRIFAGFNLSCPPAVPILVCGEIIDEKAYEAFKYYGISSLRVIASDI